MKSRDNFSETELPGIENFFSKLTEEHISDEEYAHAQTVWDAFQMRDMEDYHNLYLKTDVLLLADVFETFRGVAREKYGLDPLHYITLASYTWDAMLKFTNVKLELFTEPEQLLFIEKGIRGGISVISNRYSKANNKYMSDYDPSQESKFILYLNCNSLYAAGCRRTYL